MLRVLKVFGGVVLALAMALTFIPGMAEIVPGASVVRDVAATFAVMSSVAMLFAWTPNETD